MHGLRWSGWCGVPVSCLCMHLCQIDCGCLMGTPEQLGETHRVHSTAQISGKAILRLLFLYARVNVYAHPPCVRVFARGLMRSADLCCFHGDWFPSSVRGLNHRQRALSFPATWLRFIFQFHFHQLLPPVFSFFYFQTMTESVWSVKLERASVNNGV